LEVLDDEEGLASPSPQTVVDQGQRLDNLQRALAELPAICRSSFLLRKLDGLSHSQIAEHLNISRSLVEKHIVNAMKHCRVRMREWEAD
ncbi:pyoverdine signaling pathway sigma factor FpvI, partial [Pseudomonas aeruginosa]